MKQKMEKRRTPTMLFVILAMFVLLPSAALRKGFDVTRYTYEAGENAPHGLKILQISDLHWRGDSENMALLLATVREQSPDLIVLTGDVIDSKSPVSDISPFFKSLKSCAQVMAVSGNHDRWDGGCYEKLAALLDEAGIPFLEDATRRMSYGGTEFRVHGVSDPEVWSDDVPIEIIDDDFLKLHTFDGLDILLFHRANMAEQVANRGFELVFTGHMHGGIVRIPFIGGVASPYGTMFPKYTAGKYNIGKSTVIISRGIGESEVFPRIFNRPEIVVTEIV